MGTAIGVGNPCFLYRRYTCLLACLRVDSPNPPRFLTVLYSLPIQFTSISQLHAPGLTRASKQAGGLELLVDNSVVGSIIGKGGQTIRKMTAESGALIQVQGRDEVSPSQRERKVTVTSVSGLPSNTARGCCLVGIYRSCVVMVSVQFFLGRSVRSK